MLVSDILCQSTRLCPDKVAIFFGDEQTTYNELNDKVNIISQGLLDLGLQLGQKVAVLLDNTPEFIVSYFAIIRAGGTIVPLNTLLKGDEIKYVLNDAQVVTIITSSVRVKTIQALLPEVPELKKIISIGDEYESNVIISWSTLLNTVPKPTTLTFDDSTIAACLYTSGTTGRPKGALLSHRNLVFDCKMSVKRIPINPDDVHICILPLFHSFCEMASVLVPIYTGGSIVMIHQFSPGVLLKEIISRKVTVFCGVPSMFNALLAVVSKMDNIHNLSIRICASGGAPMPVELINELEAKCGLVIIEGNGPTETSPISYLNDINKRKVGSVGPPLDGVKVKIVDNDDQEVQIGELGEICIQGPNVMQGYLNKPEATAEAMKNGWFHTGDLGKVDDDGYVYIVDRKKDMIIVGGLNVYPREVEECLYTNKKISDASVIGISDPQRGEVPLAIISLRQGETASSAEIMSYCRTRLANYKCPRHVIFVDTLPRNSTGKIDKKQLREAYSIGLLK